jgi:hypothetical protein
MAAGARGNVLMAEGELAVQVAAAAELKRQRFAWLQRKKWPDRAREQDIRAHGTFHWGAERQGQVLMSVPA